MRITPVGATWSEFACVHSSIWSEAPAQGIGLRAPHTTSPALAAVIAVLRGEVLALGGDRYMADDIAKATALVAAGTLSTAAILALNNNPFPILAKRGHLS